MVWVRVVARYSYGYSVSLRASCSFAGAGVGSLNPQSQAPNTDGWTSLEKISKATLVAALLSVLLREDKASFSSHPSPLGFGTLGSCTESTVVSASYTGTGSSTANTL